MLNNVLNNMLTEQEKNKIWPLITQHFGIDPIKCGPQIRSEVESILGNIAVIVNPNRPSAGDEDEIYRLENKVEEYEKLIRDLSTNIESMEGSIDSTMNKVGDTEDESW